MRRRVLTVIAVVLFVAALAGWAVFLSGQGLEDADRWASVAGIFVNTLLTTASLVLAWLALRAGDGNGPVVVESGGVYAGQDIHGEVRTSSTAGVSPAERRRGVWRWIGRGGVFAGRDIGEQARIDTTDGSPSSDGPR